MSNAQQRALDHYEERAEIESIACARMLTCPQCGSASGHEAWDTLDVVAMSAADQRAVGPFYRYVGMFGSLDTLYTRCRTCRVAYHKNSALYEVWQP